MSGLDPLSVAIQFPGGVADLLGRAEDAGEHTFCRQSAIREPSDKGADAAPDATATLVRYASFLLRFVVLLQFPQLAPALVLLGFRRIRILFALQPETEPVHVARL